MQCYFGDFRIGCVAEFVHNDPKLTPRTERMAKIQWTEAIAQGILEPYLPIPLCIYRWIG